MNPVVHFELPAEDKDRMSRFYETAFGWQTTKLGKDMGEYVVATTSPADPHDPSGRPLNPGAINGGFFDKSAVDPQGRFPSLVIAVPNLDESIAKVTAAGGQIHGKAYEIPGIGRCASIVDTEGNRLSLLQPKQM